MNIPIWLAAALVTLLVGTAPVLDDEMSALQLVADEARQHRKMPSAWRAWMQP